ncbi:mevalonate kinase family protein [Caldithrix abyssi]
MIRVTAPGKMILLGEYAVLEDAPALVCAVDVRASVQIERLAGNEFVFSAPSLNLHELPFVILPNAHVRFDPALGQETLRKLTLFAGIMEYVYSRLPDPLKNQGLRIAINTDAFYAEQFHSKMGFGSSAAFCTALVKGLVVISKLDLTEAQIFRLALSAHHHAQGKMGSGIDVAASYFGGYLHYERIYENDPVNKLPQPVSPCAGLYFRPVFTGKSASTTKLVGGVKQLKEQRPEVYDPIMERLKALSVQGLQAFEQRQVELFLEKVREFYITLKNLGDQSGMPIISGVHQKLADLAHRAGVVYKPSGAGSGDIGLIFSDDRQRFSEAITIIKNSGYFPLDVDVATEGVRLEKSF